MFESMFVGAILLIPFFILIGLFFFVVWIIMLVDCLKRKFKEDSEKIIWVLVIIFAGFIGALIYYFMIYKENKKSK